MSELTATIDWLSGTFHNEGDAYRFLNWLDAGDDVKPCKPRFGYQWGNQYTSGMVVYASSESDALGVHVIMSGSTLAYYIKSGKAVLAILEKFVTNHAKVTRLDLALDLIDCPIDAVAFYNACQSGRRKGVAQTFSMVQSGSGGCTVYVGSRQSERFVRLYNKAAESQVNATWWRLELECKGDVAKEYARVMGMGENRDLGSLTWSAIKRLVETDEGGFSMFGKGIATTALPKIEKQTDTRKWLLEQCLPALENYLKKEVDPALYMALLTVVAHVADRHNNQLPDYKPSVDSE